MQIMADALTMWEELGKIEGTKVDRSLFKNARATHICLMWQLELLSLSGQHVPVYVVNLAAEVCSSYAAGCVCWRWQQHCALLDQASCQIQL